MMKSRLLKIMSYSTFFSFAFTVSLYLTFPMDAVKGKIITAMEEALGKGKQGRYGTDPIVSFSSIDLWRFSGVAFERLSLQMGSRDPDPGPTVDFDELRLRVGLLSLLSDAPEVSFDAILYDGELEGDVTVSATGEVRKIGLELEEVNIGKMPLLLNSSGVPTSGNVNGSVNLHLGKKPSKDAKGNIDLVVAGLSLGPGELELPIPGMSGGLTIPSIGMGDLTLKTEVIAGKAEKGTLAMNGKDFQAELKPALFFNDRIGRSRVSGDGWFSISEKFLKDNGKFETLISFASPLKKAKDGEGRYHFNLKGTLSSPSAKLSRPKKGKSSLGKKKPRKRPKRRGSKAKKGKKKPKPKPSPKKEEKKPETEPSETDDESSE
jgi:type II secretion system protein N